jgi:hypothetical protein
LIPPALDAMRACSQWICWSYVPKPGKPKPAKVPTDPRTRRAIDPHQPSAWMTADEASAAAMLSGGKLGVGFVFTTQDPFFFLDIDGCVTPDHQWSPLALELLGLLPRAAAECSVSGTGLHVFGRCPPGFQNFGSRSPQGVELYTHLHFAAIGTNQIGDADTVCPGLFEVAARYFPARALATAAVWTTEPVEGCGFDGDDDELVQWALDRSIDGSYQISGHPSFRDLWERNEEAFGRWPDPNRAYDESGPDYALALELAYLTGGDCERVERLMRESALYRPKWDAHATYLRELTIAKAVAYKTEKGELLKSKRAIPPPENTTPIPPAPPPPATPSAPSSEKIVAIENYPYVEPQAIGELWAGYVYVTGVDRVLTPRGELLRESQFKNTFAGSDFAIDRSGKTTKNAWKAFTEGQCFRFPRADKLCFRPNDPRPTLTEDGEVRANTWRDPKPRRAPGDPAPFVEHVRRLLPHGDDAETLLAYLAACVQHQGTKFMWCPLVQGVQGNGKSVILEVVTHAIGERYVHVLPGKKVGARFNAWAARTTLAVVEDLLLQRDTAETALESLKPMITARRIEVEGKGLDQRTESVCTNFVFLTNHVDAIPLDPNERRWAVFCCAQQTQRDLARDKLDGPYFQRLYHWLSQEDGFAIVAEYLWARPIPRALNPAAESMTAPRTTTHAAAVAASCSPEAQFIKEAAENERAGFRGGWVSTIAAMNLLRENRIFVAPQRLASELGKIGYVRHPGLDAGKCPRNVPHENGRPRLWVQEGHPDWALVGNAAAEAYELAQGYMSTAVRAVPTTPRG